VEGQAEQPPLSAAAHPIGYVQERRVDQLTVLDDPHATGLLDDEAARIAGRRRQIERVTQPVGDDRDRQAQIAHPSDVVAVRRSVRVGTARQGEDTPRDHRDETRHRSFHSVAHAAIEPSKHQHLDADQ
jgi:hypothetical protein